MFGTTTDAGVPAVLQSWGERERRAGQQQSATTRLVTRLEDRGLLERYLCPTDRRGIYTNVTAAGLKLLDEA
ncbi:MarR family winged helix-turn-helix transcriptional regulator, partial [Streptomyces xanthophaeus]|uniref:MarR family winged helix-turn-helix transcriptional regulator n=1 Tax=Streptomyces xanthophaeus TaxID=67385 RepID=UPI0036470585